MGRNDRFRPPTPDQIEVSVFGANKGECVVVHTPDDQWFVVDSFRIRDGKNLTPVACAYLDKLGVKKLFGLFVTHWHDDHSAGAADVLRRFGSTIKVVGLPDGWGKRELSSFVADLVPNSPRTKLVADVLDVMNALREPSLRAAQKIVLSAHVQVPSDGPWSLEALSPSFEDQRRHAVTLESFLPESTTSPKSYDVNSGSAVMRFCVGDWVIMLCSDLDEGDSPERGWRCIVQHQSEHLDSDIVKVGHHGSITALHLPAWAAFGRSGLPMSVVTPFPARGDRLPRKAEVKKIAKMSSGFHLSGVPYRQTSKAGKIALQRTPFSSYATVGSSPLEGVGHVRYRFGRDAGPIIVEVFSPAVSLK